MNRRYISYATLKSSYKPERLEALKKDLRRCGCIIYQDEEQLDFEFSDCQERWIVIGGLHRLLEHYQDVVAWAPNFREYVDAR